MRLAVLCIVLSSCGPVLLGEEERAQDSDPIAQPNPPDEGASGADSVATRDAGAPPSVTVRIRPLDCGKCFELHAEGSGGVPPYEFEWEDGTLRAQRTICVESANGARAMVVARDSASARSQPQSIQLHAPADTDCAQSPQMPTPPAPPARLCLENRSFEGTPAANFGQSEAFDAAPWTACTNPDVTNTPDVGNASVAQTLGPIPDPVDGDTFLALGEGEQVSQDVCSPLPDDAPVHLELSLGRLNIGAGIVPETEQVFLEIWGGLSVDCSRHTLLWASPALSNGWQRFCVTLRPRAFMTQLTLRANADATLPTPAYLLVDHIEPVDSCP